MEDIERNDIASKAVNMTAVLYEKIIGERIISIRSLFTASFWSILVLIASFFGYLIIFVGYNNTMNLWYTGPWRHYAWSILFWGLVTSVPSILLTIFIIKSIRKKGVINSILLIIISFVTSLILSLINFEICFHIAMGFGYNFSIERIIGLIKLLPYFLTFSLHGQEDLAANMAMAFSFFIPDAILLMAVFFLIIAKFIIATFELILRRILDVATEEGAASSAPFSILGAILGIFIALLSIIRIILVHISKNTII